MSLFRREEAPFITNVPQYAGKFRGTVDGLMCWEIKDPREEPFKEILETIWLELDKCRLFQRSMLVLIDIFLRGRTLESTAAYVMLAGATPKRRRKAVKHLRRSPLPRCYPGLKVDQWDWPPHAPNVIMTAKRERVVSDKRLLYRCPRFDILRLESGTSEDSKKVLDNSPLSIITASDGEETSQVGTLSCVVVVGQDVFFCAPAHIFLPLPPEDLEEDVDTDDSGSDGGSEMLRAGSATPSDLRSDSETTTQDVTEGDTDQESDELSTSTQPSPDIGYFTVFSPELDYALIPIPQGVTFHGELRCISRTTVERFGADEFEVSAVTPSGGHIHGWLDGRPTFMRLPYSSRFSKLYPVRFPSPVNEGDCGSIIVDRSTKKIYGFIVAASVEARLAYIVSADEILQDITARLGKECGHNLALVDLDDDSGNDQEDTRIKVPEIRMRYESDDSDDTAVEVPRRRIKREDGDYAKVEAPQIGTKRDYQEGKENWAPRKRMKREQWDGSPSNEPGNHKSQLHKKPPEEPPRKFACPFYKHDPSKYHSSRACRFPGFDTLHRLKEHLYRQHLDKNMCHRCGVRFSGIRGTLNDHLRADELCQTKNIISNDGINETQEMLLRARPKKDNSTNADKWVAIYKIIFPDTPEDGIPSPYCDELDSDQLDGMREYVRRGIPQLVRQKLEEEIEKAHRNTEKEVINKVLEMLPSLTDEIMKAYGGQKNEPSNDGAPSTPLPPVPDGEQRQLMEYAQLDDLGFTEDILGFTEDILGFQLLTGLEPEASTHGHPGLRAYDGTSEDHFYRG